MNWSREFQLKRTFRFCSVQPVILISDNILPDLATKTATRIALCDDK